MAKIHSMTAFARESANTEQGMLTIELRTVNHRYLDSSFKLPDSLRALEPKLREMIAKNLARGKVDCMMRLQANSQRSASLVINREMLEDLAKASSEIETVMKTAQPTALQVLQFPGICSAPEDSEEELHKASLVLAKQALSSLADNRAREGAKLAKMINERIHLVEAEVAVTKARVPELLQQQRDKVIARIQELEVDVDQGRLEQELVHLSHKADVDEELDRLDAHVSEVRRTLDKGGPCGRRLDFLMQELNREANTLSSKAAATSTTMQAVDLKVSIEQMREQIQNIE